MSKLFKSLIEPVAYHTISLRLPAGEVEGHDHRMRGSCLEPSCHRFDTLTNVLTEFSYLRRFVTNLHLGTWRSPDGSVIRDYNAFIQLVPAIKELSLNPPFLNLNLFLLENLRVLCFDFRYYWEGCKYDTHDHMPDGITPVQPLDVVAQHFWAANLRVLQLEDLYWNDSNNLFRRHSEGRYRTSPITDLRLLRVCYADVGSLPEMLLSVKTLKRFTFEAVRRGHRPDLGPKSNLSMAPIEIGKALRLHAISLVVLIIAGSGQGRFPKNVLIESLDSFVSLRRLGIPETFLVLEHDLRIHERLPPRIEELQLQTSFDYPVILRQDDPDRLFRIKMLECLARNKSNFLPSLKWMVWWWHDMSFTESAVYFADEAKYRLGFLTGIFEEVDVDFEFSRKSIFDRTPFGRMEDLLSKFKE